MASSTCYFNDCDKNVLPNSWKCLFHRHRARCLVDSCQNQVYARSLCVRHGGKKQCAFEGCKLNARLGNVCSKHGAGNIKKRCVHDGCTKQANARQKCVRHGGGRKCKIEGCSTHARSGGFCRRHSRTMLQTTHEESQDDMVLKIEPSHGTELEDAPQTNPSWMDTHADDDYSMASLSPVSPSMASSTSFEWKVLAFHDPLLLRNLQTIHLEGDAASSTFRWTTNEPHDMLDILQEFDL
ncbi:Aste57867_8428 [Aphanomyces stellatus]|uniref:Aste57867_8428 protein n=1 Tax=Aphanomyces stellatus TaxID=120398 RepID=A0A485KK89_9STRA|nr:hypothetical protein As57867_008396 [Aphanomyces stellatus]VFT85314.1 Aste57867_8428 [Aphanomyces stellatus]